MGRWIYQTDVPVRGDRTGDMALLRPEETSGVDTDGDPALVLRCAEDLFEVVTMWGDEVGEGPRPVMVRFDGDEPERAEWNVGSEGAAAFVPRGEARERFAARLLESRSLLLELRTEAGVPRQMRFEPAAGVQRVAQRLPCFPDLEEPR